jgi:hypothetical protein
MKSRPCFRRCSAEPNIEQISLAFHTKHHQNFDCVADLFLDGSWTRGRTISKPVLFEDVFIGENSVRPFLFGVLNLTGLVFNALRFWNLRN